MDPSKYPPPKSAARFLLWFLKHELAEEVLGDLEEKYYTTIAQKSPLHAKLNYWFQTLNYIRPFAIQNNILSRLNPFFMFRHNMHLAYRKNIRNKSTFLINLIGLSTGLACSILIALWVMDEVNVDKFHEKDSRLYQAMIHHQLATGIKTEEYTQGLLADALSDEIPEIELAVPCSVEIPSPFVLSGHEKTIKAYGQWVGTDFFNLFSYEVINGDRTLLLKDKKSIVISDELALKLFNTNDVIGKTIDWQIIQFNGSAIISGVFKKIDSRSSDQFDFVLPFEVWKDIMGEKIHWGNFNERTYVLLKENTDVISLNKRLSTFIQEKADWDDISMFLKPYSEKYLYGNYENGQLTGGRIEYVRLFSIIAIFILIIACINFMNLSTARATQKLKEVGIRKTIGADRATLIGQYMGESLFMAILALVTALVIVVLFLPNFNLVTGKQLHFPVNFSMILALFGITLLTGIIAGSYPALYLSKFNPVKVLKGAVNGSRRELWLRKSLVVFQFSVSIVLIVSVLVVYKQIEYIQTKNLGYDKENIITFPKEGISESNLETFLVQLKNIPGIVNASTTHHTIVSGGSSTTGVQWDGNDPNENVRFGSVMIYYDFIETLGIELVEGRSFSKEFGEEKNNLILNETAIRTMGLQNPIGQKIKLWGDDVNIVGVVKDFNFETLHEAVGPMFFKLDADFTTTIMARIETGKERETISQLEAFYKEVNPGYFFDFTFLDATYDAQYTAEARVATLSMYFAGLAILISCLGLFGLTAFAARRKLKEIGIRKILGASTFGIVRMLSTDFTRMVIVAIVIALPISYLLTRNWLDGFAFRIDLKTWFFWGAGLAALLIAWIVMGFQTVRAAHANPVECLNNE